MNFYGVAAAALLMSACSSTMLNPEVHSNLAGSQRDQVAAASVKVQSSDQSMDKFFSGPRELKNACIVGTHYKMIVNDNTANYKSTTEYSSGPNMNTRHTFSLTYDFKPSPAYFQSYTDYAYETLERVLKAYGYQVIDAETVKKSAAYNAKGEKGHTSTDKDPQYSGYFDLDANGLRHYDGNGYSAIRTLTADDEWAGKFRSETGCDLIVNMTMDGIWKVKGGDEVQGMKALVISAQNNVKLGFYVPWSAWEKASKDVGSKIYGAVNRGGNTALNSAMKSELVYAMGDNSKVPKETLDRVALFTDDLLKSSFQVAIEYQIRAFHKEAYNQKKVPETVAKAD